MNTIQFMQKHKYELLLFGLLQHLFIGVFIDELSVYKDIVWGINMLILGIVSIGIFLEKGKWEKYIRNVLFVMIFAIPLSLSFLDNLPHFMQIMSLIYVCFFILLFFEIIRFLIKPGYINIDIIFASACGYMLLIEISVFLMSYLFYSDPSSISNISRSSVAATYVDLVYFCTIVHTSIGFGDIAPTAHNTKLAISLLGVIGQFYTVILIGILISKFTSAQD